MSSRDRVDRILSRTLFKAEFAGSRHSGHDLTDSDLEVVLRYLARDKNAIVYDGEVNLPAQLAKETDPPASRPKMQP